ncbi:MAG: OmpA family protein [Desulfobacteraceae bacterium]|nr:OmpA family protein [Desulfobacteraceae bacterium]
MKNFVIVVLCLLLSVSFFSCATLDTNQKQGTAVGAGVGAGVGAILGQAIGKDTESTLIGAGIGAALGGVAGNQIGRYMDMQEKELRDVVAASEAASIRREQDILRATFKGEAFFDVNSTALKPGGYAELERVAQVLNKYPQTTIEIGGHTDIRGAAEYNQDLSLKRARTVRNALTQNGVARERMTIVGYGESRPISSDHAMNRRVEIIIVPIRQG